MNRSEYQTYLASREWALKREAVRSRSGGYCERCWSNTMDAVHHRTYERVGDERLSDLQAICDFCHEFLSGKRDDDFATCDLRVYLAGPFTNPDWRRELLSHFPQPMGTGRGCAPPICFPTAQEALPGGFTATGPWRVEESHGHGILNTGSHHLSWASPWNDGEREIVRLCQTAIKVSAFVFAWLPEPQSVPAGTLWELGYAAGHNKPVVLARPESGGFVHDDYWFASAAASFSIRAECAAQAWQQLTGEDFLPRLLRAIWRR